MSLQSSTLAVVCYGFYPRHMAQLARKVATFTGGLPATVVLVRTSCLASWGEHFAAPGTQVVELPYDGRDWEFGAYQCGLDWLLQRGWAGPVTVFNDTAGIHDPLRRRDLVALQRFVRQADPAVPALAGPVQAAPGAFALHGRAVPAWVRSNLFALSPAGLQALGHRLFVAEEFHAPRLTPQGLDLPEFLSPALRTHVQAWLMSAGPDGWRHHAGWAQPPLRVLRNKAGSILLEKRLAAQVLAAGGVLVPCNAAEPSLWQQWADRLFYAARHLGRSPRRAAGSGRTA